MVDADTLLLAYLKEEFGLQRYVARVLLSLYRARRPLSTTELAERSEMPPGTLTAALFHLRTALGAECVSPPPKACMAGSYRGIEYTLTPYGRAEVERGLNEAIAALNASLAPRRPTAVAA